MRVGVAGLGLMGSAMARRLVSRGFKLSVYNRNRSKAERLANVTIADTPAELASGCELVITVVTDFDAVREVMFGHNGIASAEKTDVVVADASTISPAQSEFCASGLRKKGIQMLGMPVMGGPSAAEAGELIPMVAGPADAFEKSRQVIDALGKHVFYVGERDGSANSLKLAMNINIALIACALSEGITLVRKMGIDPLLFLRILNSTYFKTGLSERKGPKMAAGDFEPSFHLKNMLKDLELASSTARDADLSLPQTEHAAQLFRAAHDSGYSELDYTAICGYLAEINGMKSS